MIDVPSPLFIYIASCWVAGVTNILHPLMHVQVVPHMKVVMGYPLRLVVLEQTSSLHATWVVFDRSLPLIIALIITNVNYSPIKFDLVSYSTQ